MNSLTNEAPVCFIESDPQLALLRRAGAEFTGTLLLVVVLMGTRLNGLQAMAGGRDAGQLVGPVAAGGALAGLIIAFGPLSGGQLNPLITFMQWLFRLRNTTCAITYVAAQLAGGVCGAFIAAIAERATGRVGETVTAQTSSTIAELLSSAGLMVVVFSCMAGARKEWGAFAVGAWLTASSVAIPFTFANPAVALGMTLPFHVDKLIRSSLYLTVLIEFAGAMVACVVLALLFPRQLRLSVPVIGGNKVEGNVAEY